MLKARDFGKIPPNNPRWSEMLELPDEADNSE